ncbi:MAG TPA: S16 family serine protease, partial [Syntrophales bacterium]
VIIPKDNEKDLADVPANVLKALEIVFVEHMDEVMKVAFVAADETQRREKLEEEASASLPSLQMTEAIHPLGHSSANEKLN